MSLAVQLGLLLALATAFASVVGFLYKHRGAVESPAVELRRPIRTSLALFRSHWYVLGIGMRRHPGVVARMLAFALVDLGGGADTGAGTGGGAGPSGLAVVPTSANARRQLA